MAISKGYQSLPGTKKPKRKLDSAFIGLLVGLVFAVLGLVMVYFLLYRSATWQYYVEMFTQMKPAPSFAAKNISLAMICNLIPFYFFLNKKLYQGTKGVIIATGLMGVLFILYKFVW